MESIYKNSQPSNTSTGSTAESTAYLKKSELPKNVSAFKNDMEYISSTTLDEWLRNHSYISKDEILSLINLTVVDSIQNSTDESAAIRRLEEYDSQLRGEIVEIKDKLSNLGADKGFITSDKESSLATKMDVNEVKSDINSIKTSIFQLQSDSQNYLTSHQSLEDYAKKSDIPQVPSLTGYAKKTEVDEVRNSIPSVDNFVTNEELENKHYLTSHQSLDSYAKTADLNRKISQVQNQIPDITGYATQEWVENKNYLTVHQSLEDYAKKTEIPSLTGYVKESDLNKTLKLYAKTEDTYNKVYINSVVDTLLPKTTASETYETKTNIKSTYLTKKDASDTYLAIEDYKGAPYIGENGNWYIGTIDTGTKAIGNDGEDGKSAYYVAVDNGFIGTESEWLESLKYKKTWIYI